MFMLVIRSRKREKNNLLIPIAMIETGVGNKMNSSEDTSTDNHHRLKTGTDFLTFEN